MVQSGGHWMSLPTVSILILNYNGREHLETCLPTLEAQVYPKDQVRIEVIDKGGEHAVAAARAVPSGDDDRLAPAMRAVLARAAQVTGAPVHVLAVDPSGLAVEVAADQVAGLTGRGADDGLCPAATRPGWFEICPP